MSIASTPLGIYYELKWLKLVSYVAALLSVVTASEYHT